MELVTPSDRACYQRLIQTYQTRKGKRDKLDEQSKAELDSQLSRAISNFASHTSYSKPATLAPELRQSAPKIMHLLNRGATASKLCNYELGATSNVGDLTHLFTYRITESLSRVGFGILNNLVASPCRSWLTQRTYVGNGGQSIYWFILELVLCGRVRYFDCELQSENTRHRAWWLFKRMVWISEYDTQGMVTFGLVPRPCSDGMYSVPTLGHAGWVLKGEERYPKRHFPNALDKQMLALFATFFQPRAKVRSLEYVCTEFEHLSLLVCESSVYLLQKMDESDPSKDFLLQNVSIKAMNFLCSSKRARRLSRDMTNYKGWRKWFLRDDVLRELCRRKERRLFEHLLRKDERIREWVPKALAFLQSKEVRGRKERIIELLTAALEQAGINGASEGAFPQEEEATAT